MGKRVVVLASLVAGSFLAVRVWGQGALGLPPARPGSQAQAADQTALIDFHGGVFVRSVGDHQSRRVLSIPLMLKPGDEVRTELNAEASIRFRDLSQVRLGSNTTFLIQKEQRSTISLFLSLGKLWAEVTKNKDRAFEVYTPAAVAAVRGTQFSVEAKATTEMITEVQAGLVSVRALIGGGHMGTEVPVAAGFGVNVLGGVVSPPRAIQSALPHPVAPTGTKTAKAAPPALKDLALKWRIGREIGLQNDLQFRQYSLTQLNSTSSLASTRAASLAASQPYTQAYFNVQNTLAASVAPPSLAMASAQAVSPTGGVLSPVSAVQNTMNYGSATSPAYSQPPNGAPYIPPIYTAPPPGTQPICTQTCTQLPLLPPVCVTTCN